MISKVAISGDTAESNSGKNVVLVRMKNDPIKIKNVERLWDGGSIRIECSYKDNNFSIILQRPKDNEGRHVRVYVFDENSKPNLETELLPNTPDEEKLVEILTHYVKMVKDPKFHPDVKSALKYIKARDLPWKDAVWILPK